VRDWDARVAFEQALAGLRRCAGLPLSVAVFTSAEDFAPLPARRKFFDQACAAAVEVWRFEPNEHFRSTLALEAARTTYNWPLLTDNPSR
jgi:hypothetical protein